MTIQRKFRKSGDIQTLTFDFLNAATGTGYINWYGIKTQSSYSLVNSPIESDIPFEEAPIPSSTPTLAFDVDFDLEIEFPQIINGTLVGKIPIKPSGNTSGNNYSAYAIVKFRKWDGSTETDITSATSATITQTWSGSTFSFNKPTLAIVEMDISNQKFKAGDTLRLTVEVWVSKGSGSNAKIYFGHDPLDRAMDKPIFGNEFDSQGETKVLSFLIPYKLNT